MKFITQLIFKFLAWHRGRDTYLYLDSEVYFWIPENVARPIYLVFLAIDASSSYPVSTDELAKFFQTLSNCRVDKVTYCYLPVSDVRIHLRFAEKTATMEVVGWGGASEYRVSVRSLDAAIAAYEKLIGERGNGLERRMRDN
jgi:hypothetical protein